MELPQQAVNALIQRTTESSSESESHAPPNPSTLYANSLLQQFVVQTQLLNAPCAVPPNGDVSNQNSAENSNQKLVNGSGSKDVVKRKRGRPKKAVQHRNESNGNVKAVASGEYCSNPNVSPDSGIQNSPDHVSSPESCPSPNSKSKQLSEVDVNRRVINNNKTDSSTKNGRDMKQVSLNKSASNIGNKLKEHNKVPVTSNRFDRLLYANTDRVLYPPRRKVGRPPINRKGPGRPPKHKPHVTEQNRPQDKKMKEGESEHATSVSIGNGRIGERNGVKLGKNKRIIKDQLLSTGNVHISESGVTRVNGNKEVSTKKTKSRLLHDICEKVSKRLEMNGKPVQKIQEPTVKCEKNDRANKANHRRNRSATESKIKLSAIKSQYTTLKNAKLMHSKHKHKKHKKCKFKILKPLSAAIVDAKVNIDVEKLIADFVKYCCISSSKPSKENIPEMMKVIKKVSKKRKTSEYNERKKKKQTVNSVLNKETSSNEQRLPLKKRHYHLSASSENKSETPELSNSTDGTSDKPKIVANKNVIPAVSTKAPTKSLSPSNNISNKPESIKASPTNTAKYINAVKIANTTPPKINNTNNNEYGALGEKSESVRTHIDEAIEACITRFSGDQNKSNLKIAKTADVSPKEEKTNTITTTTPKKRHRFEHCTAIVENDIKQELPSPTLKDDKQMDIPKVKSKSSLETVVNELKLKRNLTNKVAEIGQKKDKKCEAMQVITRKKNRLEDLTSSLVSKISSSPTDNVDSQKRKKEAPRVEEASRDSVIRYPVCKKIKPVEPEKLDFIDARPTGIFMPTTDLEVLIPANTIELKKELIDANKNLKKGEDDRPPVLVTVTKSHPKLLQTADVIRRKIRKRRAINRTGFPTVKKKKKKVLATENIPPQTEVKVNECDRVPKTGEEYAKFLQRTEKACLNIEKTTNSEITLPTNSDTDNTTKWEALSECDSLPQEERTEIEQDDVLKSDQKRDKMCLRARDVSPATSVDTLSDKTKTNEDLDELPLEVRVREMKMKSERMRQKREMLLKKRKHYDEGSVVSKRKARDLSPASSVEQFMEKRLREERASASSDEARRNKKVPRWRKRYLVAGLFSDYYKEDE